MTKWIVSLLLVNLALFGWMRWGHTLTAEADTPVAQAALNADKIKLLEWTAVSAVASGVSTTSGMTLTLSPIAMPAVTVVPSVLPVSAPAVAHAQPQASSCAEWGEFSGSDLARAQQSLAVLKLGDALAQRSVERNHGYWVYIPPLKKRSQVERKIAQLKERGVEDYFVVQEEGRWQNAISLGVFKSEEAAQKFLASLQAKDVRTAKIGERVSKLRYIVFVMKNLDAGIVGKLNAMQKEFPDSELKVSACGN